MKEIILILALIGIMIYGYFLMKKLDAFMLHSRQWKGGEDRIRMPSQILLEKNMSDEEMIKEIRSFRSKHPDMKVLLVEGRGKKDGNSDVAAVENRKIS